jgi:DNA-binding transcriptional LysR family regulator
MPLISPAALLLDEVARVGSIRRAAERLNTSASAVNRQILNLEADYGVPLFERLPRGVRLTAAGETLVAEVRRWRRDEERAIQHLQQLRGLRRGHVSIALVEAIAFSFLPRIMQRAHERYPGMTFDLTMAGTEDIIGRLMAKTADVGVAFNMPRRPDIRFIRTWDEPLGLVVARDHPLAERASVYITDCVGYTLILPDYSLAFRTLVENALSKAAIRSVAMITTNSTLLMKKLLANSGHVALLGKLDVIEELAAGTLRFLPLSGSAAPRRRP